MQNIHDVSKNIQYSASAFQYIYLFNIDNDFTIFGYENGHSIRCT